MAISIGGRRQAATLVVTLGLVMAVVSSAVSQQTPSGTGKAPGDKAGSESERRQFDIQADNGIEWDKDRQVYIARGNVRILRGDRMMQGAVATAYYRAKEGGKNEIFKVDVDGNVRVAVGNDTAVGDKGSYNLDSKVFMLTGRSLVYNTQDARVTARDSLEYHEDRKIAIARGNAYAVREHEWIRGDVLIGYFEERREKAKPKTAGPAAAAGSASPAVAASAASVGGDEMVTRSKLVRIEAMGNVIVNSCDGIGRSDKLIYFPDTGEARLEGNARLTRGEMQMRGERAEMNTRTQFMRLLPGPDGKQVAGTFFSTSESMKPDNIPFEAGGIDPCKDREKQKPGEAGKDKAVEKAADKPAGTKKQ